MATTATNIKLPSTLKAELEKLARRSGETTHAVMLRGQRAKRPSPVKWRK